MFKIIIITALSFHLLFSATSEQVDQYMSLSHSDRALIEIEQMFENLTQSIENSESNQSTETTLAYEIYIGKHISEDEMKDLLAIYRKPVMQRYVVEMDTTEIPQEEMKEFLLSLEENPISTERMDIINEIIEHTLDEEVMLNFYKSMMQRYLVKDNNNTKETDSSKKSVPNSDEQEFIDLMKEATREELLYGTQVLSMEEMQEISNIFSSTLMNRITKVESQAVIQIMDDFIKLIILKPKLLDSITND